MADKQVSQSREALAEALTEVCKDAMTKAGFAPSERLLEKFHEEISHAISVR